MASLKILVSGEPGLALETRAGAQRGIVARIGNCCSTTCAPRRPDGRDGSSQNTSCMVLKGDESTPYLARTWQELHHRR